MGLEIRPIQAPDLDRVGHFLAQNLGGAGGADRYRRILDTRWSSPKPNFGFLLENELGVQGVLGLLYSQRTIDGRIHRICNMSSWCVAQAHRRSSLALLRSMIDQEGHVFTNFSPTPGVATILERVGFQRLDIGKLIVFPGAGGLPRAGVTVFRKAAEVRRRLEADERPIFADHSLYRCGQYVLEEGGHRCYVVTVKRGKRGVFFADILHASDPELLSHHLPSLFLPAFLEHGTFALGVDARFVKKPSRFSRLLPRPSYFLGAVPPRSVSSIYSELVGIYG